jgi:hypothetical protein
MKPTIELERFFAVAPERINLKPENFINVRVNGDLLRKERCFVAAMQNDLQLMRCRTSRYIEN